MQWEQHFTLEGRYLGSSGRTFTTWSKDASPPHAYSFCCPTCGSVWAACPIVGRPFHFLTRGCPAHQQWGDDGSLWTSWDPDFTGAFPTELLRLELLYLLDRLPQLQLEDSLL